MMFPYRRREYFIGCVVWLRNFDVFFDLGEFVAYQAGIDLFGRLQFLPFSLRCNI